MTLTSQDVRNKRAKHEQSFEPVHDDAWGIITERDGSTNPPGRPNWDWVDMHGLGISILPALNDTTLRKAGTTVQIGNDPRPPGIKVLGPYTRALSPVSDVDISRFSTPPHGANHAWFDETQRGDDAVPIWQPAWQPLKTAGDGVSLVTTTQPLIYNHNGVPRRFPGARINHTADVPSTASSVRRVLVYLDETSGTLNTVAGTEVADNGVVPIPYPTAPAAGRISAYVTLRTGQTVIDTAQDVEDQRDLLDHGVTHFRHLYDVDFSDAADGDVPIYDADTGLIVMGPQTGGGTPGGSDSQIQYNDGGAFGGANLYWIDTTGRLGINEASPDNRLHLTNVAVASPPTTTSGDFVIIENEANANLAFITGATSAAAIRFYKNAGTSHNAHLGFNHSTGQFEIDIGGNQLLVLEAGQGLIIGSDVQAWDAQLDGIAALAVTKGNIIAGNGTDWVALPVGGVDGHVLTIDSVEATGMKWAAQSGGGPAGDDTYVQFNDGGAAFGGEAAFVYDKTNDQLKLTTSGSAAGLLIGGDVQLYRSAADILTIPDSVYITGSQVRISTASAPPLATPLYVPSSDAPAVFQRDNAGVVGVNVFHNGDTTNGNAALLTFSSPTTGAGATTIFAYANIGAVFDIHNNATRAGSIILRTAQAGGSAATRMTIGGGMQLGTTVTGDPGMGQMSGHSGVGGFLFWTGTVVGSTVTVIPNGTGDVTAAVRFSSATYDGVNGATFSGGLTPSNNLLIHAATLRLTCNADGSVVLDRVSGTATFTVSLWLNWI